VETEAASAPETAPETYSLRGHPAAITLEADGLHHPTGTRRGRPVYSAYRDITHLATSSRALWIGTRRSVYIISRNSFVDPNGPEHLVRALLARIARQPGGGAQLARMTQIEEAARTSRPARATWGLLIVCAIAYAVQVLGGPEITLVGSFIQGLAEHGDWWRVVTANLLHANEIHLVLNLFALLAVGTLIERALGTARTACVMAASGVGAMVASAFGSSLQVVGVSGVVSGLLGALCWLELRFAESMPSWWRVPRRALFLALAVNAVISMLPFIATVAHAGGFVAGGVAAAALAWRTLDGGRSGLWLRGAALASVAVSALAVGAASRELLLEGDYHARFVERLGSLPGSDPETLNNVAWEIAVDPESPPELLETALALAQRAVADTGREKAHILDTLAEVHFQLGHRAEALAAIEEAILRNPGEDYYREQRRRFLGERDLEDRPFLPPQEEAPGLLPDEEGLSV
jgi:rhomboid protease GluP